jgi:hypothetical protein
MRKENDFKLPGSSFSVAFPFSSLILESGMFSFLWGRKTFRNGGNNMSEKDFTADQRVKILERSFDMMEEILLKKEYKSKEEVLEEMKKKALKLDKDDSVPEVEKRAAMGAYRKLEGLTYAEIKEIIDILK